MPEVKGIDKLLSVIPKKRFGKFNQYATSQFGFSCYSDDDIFYRLTGFGDSVFGLDNYANILPLSGIYRSDNVTGETKYYREPYYITKNPQSPDQQVQRQKYADSIIAWKALTQDQKNVYNERAKFKNYSGYNLFQKEYLLSH